MWRYVVSEISDIPGLSGNVRIGDPLRDFPPEIIQINQLNPSISTVHIVQGLRYFTSNRTSAYGTTLSYAYRSMFHTSK